jgi:hypothetical protein
MTHITIEKEKLEQVLAALEKSIAITMADIDLRRKAITAIKQALAAPVQESVVTDWERIAKVQDAKLRAMCNEPKAFEQLCELMDKYEALRPTPPTAQPAPVQQPVENEWRKLALRFDAHRMSALAHLRAMVQDPAKHADVAREFLSAPPPAAPVQDQKSCKLCTHEQRHYMEMTGPCRACRFYSNFASATPPAAPVPKELALPYGWNNLTEYILQDDLHNCLTPRVVDIAYSAFMMGRIGKNSDDGGPCDWFNDTKPMVMEQLAKIRKDLAEAACSTTKKGSAA